MRCPSCGYIRKQEDIAPEWQCPACQVAYAKASQRSVYQGAAPPAPPRRTAGSGGSSLPIGTIFIAALIACIAYFGYSYAKGNAAFSSIGISAENNQELIANKKAELAAYEQGLQQVEEQIAQARANVGTCAITGQPNQFILNQDPRPELLTKIDQLKADIRKLEGKS